jgi:uncharacterized protein (TIGR02246 family)
MANEPITMTAEQASVLAALDTWITTLTTGTPEQVAALYAEEAVFWGTASPSLRTTPQEVKRYFELFTSELHNPSVIYHHPHVRVYGDVAINSGYYTFFFERDGKMMSLAARYTFTYRRQGNNWLIIDHHSSAVPA